MYLYIAFSEQLSQGMFSIQKWDGESVQALTSPLAYEDQALDSALRLWDEAGLASSLSFPICKWDDSLLLNPGFQRLWAQI